LKRHFNKPIKSMFFMLIIFSVLFLGSCQNNDKIENISTEIHLEELGETGIIAENKAVDFYFYFPENWILQRNDTMITIYLYSDDIIKTNVNELSTDEPLSYMIRPNVSADVFTLLEGYETIEDYWVNFAAPSFRQVFENVVDESEEDLTVDGVPAKKYTYTLSLSGIDFKFTQIIFFNKDRVYTLTYTSTEDKHATYISVLNTVAETFKFK